MNESRIPNFFTHLMGGHVARVLGVTVFVSFSANCFAAAADATAKDIQVAARTIAFMENAPTGPTPVAILYDPTDVNSTAEAEAIKELIGKFPKAGNATLQPALTPVDTINTLKAGQIAFVTQGISDGQASVFEVMSSLNILTIAIGEGCVREGRCVVGVVSSPKVQILVSKAASDAASVKFSSAFLMMIKEV